jgi:kynurenine formamidase
VPGAVGLMIGFTRVVFLSHVLDASVPVFPGDSPVQIDTTATIEHEGYYLQSFTAGEQSGTHWAAPAHFNPGEATADQLDPDDFFFPAVVLDMRAEVAENADFTLDVAEIERWEADFGPVPQRGAVIMWTGFEDRWDDPAAYLNEGADGLLHYPGFAPDAVQWLVDHRAIGALGIDTMGIDAGNDEMYRANRLLLRGHRIHLENLAGLGQMPPTGGWIITAGLRIRAGSGSPATVFGLIP